jgi:hypothetical protein
MPNVVIFQTWVAILNNMTTVDVLSALPSILKLKFDKCETVRETAATILSKEGAKASPTQVYITLKNYQKALKK